MGFIIFWNEIFQESFFSTFSKRCAYVGLKLANYSFANVFVESQGLFQPHNSALQPWNPYGSNPPITISHPSSHKKKPNFRWAFISVEPEGLFQPHNPALKPWNPYGSNPPITISHPSVHKKKRNFRWAFISVEPEGFEPSSKHSMIYAFYMLSFSLIVGRGKVSRLPIPFSVVAVSRLCLATSQRPVLLFDAPSVRPKNRI